MTTTYKPISCDFHDVLESLATTRQPARIHFRDGNGGLQDRTATIRYVFSRASEEYVVFSTGETVRLDRLVDVDGFTLEAPAGPGR